jgi:hypothetical protein
MQKQQLNARLVAYIGAWRAVLAQRWSDEGGEGVISTALAVLIVAFLGLAAFKLFDGLISDSGAKAQTQINSYGGK